jgi:hypothetical protein
MISIAVKHHVPRLDDQPAAPCEVTGENSWYYLPRAVAIARHYVAPPDAPGAHAYLIVSADPC